MSNNNGFLLDLASKNGPQILPKHDKTTNVWVNCIQARIPKVGVVGLGMTGHLTALIGAMIASGFDSVCLLLQHGADPYESDVNGNDAFMFASAFGNTENAKFWLERFPDWDLERKNKVAGGIALGQAVHMGPH